MKLSSWWSLLLKKNSSKEVSCAIENWLADSSESCFSLQESKRGELSLSLVEQCQRESLGIGHLEQLPPLFTEHELYQKIPYSFLKNHLFLPYVEKKECEKISVLLSDPLLLAPLSALRFFFGYQIDSLFQIDKKLLLLAIEACYTSDKSSPPLLSSKEEAEFTSEEGPEILNLLEATEEDAPVVRLINRMLSEAIGRNASDIHIEPHGEGVSIRYRIDGMLQPALAPTLKKRQQIIARIKVMAKLDIAEQRLPQDGRVHLKRGEKSIDLRISTIPIHSGERVVIRILDQNREQFNLHSLAMSKRERELFSRWITSSEGMILVTGPTGSGKTTTLYNALGEIHREEINIMTIEDPVEVQMEGIAQIGVRPQIDLTFAKGLRHILRQDPDVILIGEIRDHETATIALQAALTGHLVLTTLHTNDAASSVTRLVDMGIETYLLFSSLIGVVAQRLVRKLCEQCKESYTLSKEKIEQLFPTSLPIEESTPLYRPTGCSHCNQTGYLGRRAIYEWMDCNRGWKKELMRGANSLLLRDYAIGEGMIPLRERGLQFVLEGITSVAEVIRVTS